MKKSPKVSMTWSCQISLLTKRYFNGKIIFSINLTFKDLAKNTIKQLNKCMTDQNINSLAIDLPIFS